MTDKELLELAAKAAGIELHHWSGDVFIKVADDVDDDGGSWNPLTDDGDALRLAVKLEIKFSTTPSPRHKNKSMWVAFNTKINGANHQNILDEDYGDDPYAATRRAIVRAAAEIGRAMG